MPIEHSANLSFNAGAIGREAIARLDVPKLRMAGEIQENLLPRVIGPMVFRPGSGYLGFTTYNNVDGCTIPFVFDIDTTARIELTEFAMRFIVNDVVVSRPSVSTTVTNGDFTTDLTGWTDADEVGATSEWFNGYMKLTGTGENRAVRTQEVTVGGGDIGVEHALRVVIARGTVGFKVGSADQEDDYVADTLLGKGEHSLAFTPTGNFFITIYSDNRAIRYVDSCTIEPAGDVVLTTPWEESRIRLVRYHQSLDVIYCAVDGIQQRKIERRAVDDEMRSWSLVIYQVDDGPFRTPNFTATTIVADDTTGLVNLVASRPIWKSGHLGSLWRLTYTGQTVTAVVGGDDQWSDPIRISGVHTDGPDPRTIDVAITGVFVATITIQIAFGDPSGWSDTDHTYTAPATDRFQDKLDNEIVYYRIGIVSGDYTSGSATVTLTNAGGVQNGIVRITDFTDSTHVAAEVVETLGNTDETSDWAEGEWSDYRGWPGAVVIDNGRLVWGWQDRVFMSVSDAYESYDDTVEGDSGPVIRTVTNGSRDGVLWLVSAQRLLAGTATTEPSMRSSSFDEPITPTKFSARDASSRGCAPIQAVVIDGKAIFVQRGGDRAFILTWPAGTTDYTSENICRANDDILAPGVTGIAVQRNPDTRVWFTLTDGTAAVFTFEPSDEVAAWTPVITDGEIVDISVLPGTPEDIVYWIVKRVVDGADIYFHERMATLDQVDGDDRSRTIDSYVVYTGSPTTTVSVPHLPGMDVVIWADGAPLLEPYATDVSGNVTLNDPVSTYVAGLSYTGRFQSAKNATGTALGISLGYPQKLDHVALIMQDVTPFGIRVGRDFNNMFRLPRRPGGAHLDDAAVEDEYDYRGAPFDGGWSTDARVCITIRSPFCAKFLAMAVSAQTGEAKVITPRQSGG